MPAALKTPLLEPDFAPDNSNPASNRNSAAPARASSQASPRAAAAAVSGASARAAAPARIPSREREEEHDVSARPVRSRPSARSERQAQEAAPARLPRIERRHRRFRPTITAVLCSCAVLGQLVLLLWLHGKTLTSAREVEKVDAQITEVSNQIERTQERVAAFDSSPQIKQWAQQQGWRPATHLDIDAITEADQARAATQAQDQGAPSQGGAGGAGEVDAR